MEEARNVAIIGVTGLIGSGLPGLFASRGFSVTGVSRSGGGTVPHVDRWQTPGNLDLRGHEVVVNLAGEPIDRRWTAGVRKALRESRVGVTRDVVAAIARLPEGERPRVLVNGSAVGIYGDGGDEVLTELSPRGSGYLAGLCADWEAAALEAEDPGVRVVLLRTGIVLEKKRGALGKLVPVFKAGLGGRLGSGRQWMPWVHAGDLRAMILHAVLSERIRGPVNGTAPLPERNVDFTRKLAGVLRRPAVFPVPEFALRMALGECSTALVASQRVVPAALESDGFVFRHPALETALDDLLR